MRNLLSAVLLILAWSGGAAAQKVAVGYDKSADFSTFATYSWAQPDPAPARPVLYASVVGSVDYQLKTKSLQVKDSEGDLLLVASGGIDFGINNAAATPMFATYSGPPPYLNSTMWTGYSGINGSLTAQYVPSGSMALSFIERKSNKVLWSGTVTEKLDQSNPKKSLALIDKAVAKLLANFPPVKK